MPEKWLTCNGALARFAMFTVVAALFSLPASAFAADLYAEKSVSWADMDGNNEVTETDTLTYRIVLHNQDLINPLTNVTFSDTVPTGLTYQTGSTTITSGGWFSVVGQSVEAIIFNIAPGASVVATYKVTIDAPLVDADMDNVETFTNQGTADSDQTDPVLSDGNGDPTDGEQATSITAVVLPFVGMFGPDIDFQKRAELAVDGNGNGIADPGDEVEYTIRFTNAGPARATGVSVTDPMAPASITVVPPLPSANPPTVVINPAWPPLDATVGIVDPGELVIIRYRVEVNALAACSIISNQATATGTNFVPPGPVDSEALIRVSWTDDCGALTKSVVGSSEPDSLGSDVFIGEVVRFHYTIAIPEGGATLVELTDILPSDSSPTETLTYMAGTARLQANYDIGLSSSVNFPPGPGGINLVPSGTFVNLTDGVDIDITGQIITLDLGTVTNSDAPGDGNAESYVLEIQALVMNVPLTQAGTTLENAAELTFRDSVPQDVTLTDSEILTVNASTFSVVMTGSPPEMLREIGGTVSYSVAVTNVAGAYASPGYDVEIVDQRPPQVTNLRLTSLSSAGGIVSMIDDSSSGRIKILVDEFPVGAEVFFTCEGTVLPPVSGGVVKNPANVFWTSLPGTNGTWNVTPGLPGNADGERDELDNKETDSYSTLLSGGVPEPTATRTPVESCSSRELNECDDGADNDCDGLVDCADTMDCSRAPNCAAAPCLSRELNLCNDGIDNDCDGLVDCADMTDCSRASNCAAAPCLSRELNLCNDAIDNDCDGITDCNDSDCSNATACTWIVPTNTPTPTRTPLGGRDPAAEPVTSSMRILSVSRANPGTTVHYSIAATVRTGVVAGARVRIDLPPELEYVTAFPVAAIAPASGTSGTVEVQFGNIAGPQTLRVDVVARLRDDLTLGNRFFTTAWLYDQSGPLTYKRRTTRAGAGVSRQPKPNVGKSGTLTARVQASKQVSAGNDLRYTLAVRTKLDSTDVVVRSVLPQGVDSFNAIPEPSVVFPEEGGWVLEWRTPFLAGRQRLRYRVYVQTSPLLSSGQMLQNQVTVTDAHGESVSLVASTQIR